jgi:uncharacterized protein (DUF1810 family)
LEDIHNLQRFLSAQSGIFEGVVAELSAGRKRSHWMWFIFPQIAGLGHSAMAEKYAIGSASEARAYLEHPILGARLRQCTQLVIDIRGRGIDEIFGNPDDVKFCSSMTLFMKAAADPTIFKNAIDKYFAGVLDQKTLEMLARLQTTTKSPSGAP